MCCVPEPPSVSVPLLSSYAPSPFFLLPIFYRHSESAIEISAFLFFLKSNCVIIHGVNVLQCVDEAPAAGLWVSLLLLRVIAQ